MKNRRSVDVLTNYITGKYSEITSEMEAIGSNKNINRYTTPIMSPYVENAIALLVNDELKNKKYNYAIEPQLSVPSNNPKKTNSTNTIKPDIIIYDNNHVIHGIIEVKAQLGYFRAGDGTEYVKKINRLKEASNIGKLSFNKEKYTIDKNLADMIVVLMKSNMYTHLSILEKEMNSNKKDYYVLYDGKVWYDDFPYEKINKDSEHGMEAFIKKIKGI